MSAETSEHVSRLPMVLPLVNRKLLGIVLFQPPRTPRTPRRIEQNLPTD
jgi:hypothetical protein